MNTRHSRKRCTCGLVLLLVLLLHLAGCGSSSQNTDALASSGSVSGAVSGAISDAASGSVSDAASSAASTALTSDAMPDSTPDNTPAPTRTPTPTPESPPVFDDLPTICSGVLTVATCPDFPPYVYKDGPGRQDGQLKGLDIELVGRISELLGLTLQLVEMNYEDLGAQVAAGHADLAIAGLTSTQSDMLRYTDSYADSILVVMVRADSELYHTVDLPNEMRTIGVLRDSTADLYATWQLEDTGKCHVMRYDTTYDPVYALSLGYIDCVLTEDTVARQYINDMASGRFYAIGGLGEIDNNNYNNEDTGESEAGDSNSTLRLLDLPYSVESYVMALSQESAYDALYEAVNTVLAYLYRAGELDTLWSRYVPVY